MIPLLKFVMALLLCGVVAGCAGMRPGMEPPGLMLTSLQLTEVALLAQQYELGVRLQNPNREPLVVEGLRYQLDLNGERFARGASAAGITVPGYGEADLTLQLSVNTLQLAGRLMAWMENPPEAFEYRILGQIDLQGLVRGLPFESAGRVSLSAESR